MKNRPMASDRAQMSAVRYFLFKAMRENDTAGLPWYEEQTHGFGSSPDVGSPVLPFQNRARKRYGRTSGAWFSKSVKGLSLKFGGQHLSGMKNRPKNSDRAQIPAVRYYLFKTVRENDTAGLPGLGSRNP
ncbi:hypothetical protein Taro_010271 [Colocasia esculenta]|uniref:Uncharacterized protein n=1 Tax=Colocasia esculenta TaxID=4460 RepID=A0A843U936_COLES|nr:hypothetical protein [Colocasia esculenta]